MLTAGWARQDYTPERPVMLHGQMRVRVSEGVQNPVGVTALAVENAGEGVIFLALDLCGISSELLQAIRDRLQTMLPEFDARKLVAHATHTHTSLVTIEGTYNLPEGSGAMTPAECREWVAEHCAAAAVAAWKARRPATMARGLGHAVLGHNRRATYMDGSTYMYGNTARPDFSHFEGYEDHRVHLLYWFDDEDRLTGIVVNLACPAQETEHEMTVSADLWHEVREEVRRRFDPRVHVLPQCSPAGDQSPHLMLNREVEEYMRGLRGLTRREELARRLMESILDVYPVVQGHASGEGPLAHHIESLDLPGRIITRADYDYAQAELQTVLDQDPKTSWAQRRLRTMMAQYEAGGEKPSCSIELHVIKIGEVVFATNPFELFLDYGLRLQARSRAGQTFLVQLANGVKGYLPVERAIAQHYSGLAADNHVGPAGGQQLVERTLEIINEMFSPENDN